MATTKTTNKIPKLFDVKTYIEAGINPKTGLPSRLGLKGDYGYKNAILRNLEIEDRQIATRRYVWSNCYKGVTGELIEKILYFKGQLMFFYVKELDKFFVLPYTLQGDIGCYGEYIDVSPLVFGDGQDKEDKIWIPGLTRRVIYDFVPFEEWTPEMMDTCCVIIRDYGEGLSQKVEPRWMLNRKWLEKLAECLPIARTAILGNSSVRFLKVPDESAKEEVKALNQTIEDSAIGGLPFSAIASNLDVQDLNGSTNTIQDVLLYMQTLDNLRMSTFGLSKGGLFEKKAHMLQDEANMNSLNSDLIFDDGLACRQTACDIINSVFGGYMMCLPNEVITEIDYNMDGQIGGENQTELPVEEEGEISE